MDRQEAAKLADEQIEALLKSGEFQAMGYSQEQIIPAALRARARIIADLMEKR